jgi:ADP-ribosyl-[dinitrogen reductase] hydrolase
MARTPVKVLAANLGGDADTVAAVSGGVAGGLWGIGALPQRWVRALGDGDVVRLEAV